MQTRALRFAFIAFAISPACAPMQAAAPAQAATPAPVLGPAPAAAPPAAPEPHHELHLPPVGTSVHVTLDGKSADVALGGVPHEGNAASLAEVWKVAFPSEDAAPLHFDLVGSDGFHPASRPMCARLITGAEVKAARIDVTTHNVTYDDALNLPGCYRVKGVVSIDATR
jgi:hypothetical protein